MAAEAPQATNVHRTARLRVAVRIESRIALGRDSLGSGRGERAHRRQNAFLVLNSEAGVIARM